MPVCDAAESNKSHGGLTMIIRDSKPMLAPRVHSVSEPGASKVMLGRVKWFGGFNNYTGRENHFGFIESEGVDFFAHRSHVLSPQEKMTEGAEVLFHRFEGRDGKLAAKAVRVLSATSDDELVRVVRAGPAPSADLIITIALKRKKLEPFIEDVHAAVTALNSAQPNSTLLTLFWQRFPPAAPSDRFFNLAPEEVKARVCKQHYAVLRQTLSGLLASKGAPSTSVAAADLYEGLDDQDRKIAALWADSDADPIVSQMLSARAAEKAAAQLYRKAGAEVEDVAVSQLNRSGMDWITHDLIVDQTLPVDVKNSRRPINSKGFYVEHTIPRFKVTRGGADVRIAGVLSPYLQRRYIEKPRSAWFTIDDIVFLGETSRRIVDDLIKKYSSAHFEVRRGDERMFPNWVFGYPERWYPGLKERVRQCVDMCCAVPAEHWRYIFSPHEGRRVVPAFCAMGVPLPAPLEDRLSTAQAAFYRKLQRNLQGIPTVPDIFLLVLSDFVQAIVDDRQDYAPSDYNDVLFPQFSRFAAIASDALLMEDSSFPLGAIDPLHLVSGLVQTLNTLWENRIEMALMGFTNFRFAGLGLLQARREKDAEWTTILAYCGGTEYQKDGDGKVSLSEAGRPIPKGKCGFSPLILGEHKTCPSCRKLVCSECDFCSAGCRDEAMRELVRGRHSADKSRQESRSIDNGQKFEAPPWEFPPLEAYEDLR